MRKSYISVKLMSMKQITDKCYLAKAFDGSEAFIPTSQVYGEDYSHSGDGEAWFITEWILERKDLQYSTKRKYWIDDETGKRARHHQVTVEHHVPKQITDFTINEQKDLQR